MSERLRQWSLEALDGIRGLGLLAMTAIAVPIETPTTDLDAEVSNPKRDEGRAGDEGSHERLPVDENSSATEVRAALLAAWMELPLSVRDPVQSDNKETIEWMVGRGPDVDALLALSASDRAAFLKYLRSRHELLGYLAAKTK